jgi:DNA-binding response OmpR family regulator
VEDDRRIALALTLRLRAAGHVLLAHDASTALDSATKNHPDLVLFDIRLPCGSGLVVAESILNAGGQAHVCNFPDRQPR